MKNLILTAALFAAAIIPARAGMLITEVDPTGSSSSYGGDWFELTNTGPVTVDITNWKMDDNSNSAAVAVALRGVTSIAPGKSVIFIEGGSTNTGDAALEASFTSAWFGGSVPAGFTIGAYGGSGVGLSSAGDAVNVFDASNALVANVSFGASTTGVTFDNAVGLNNTTISTLSRSGVNGAFVSTIGEVGSPAAVPEPKAYALMGFGMLLGVLRLRCQQSAKCF